ncbi:MAG: IclR family transcriptional regulator [Rhodospirillales bacterium]
MSTTIRKGLQVLQYLAYAERPQGMSEIARAIDLNKSAVQRILNTLHATDYVEKAPGTSKYQLTLSIWELGSHVVERHEARRLLHPILRFGAQNSGYTAFLVYRSFPFVVYLDKVEGAQGRPYSAEPGSRIPINATAAGKAVLAYLPDETLADLARDQTDWTGFLPFVPCDPDALREELAEVREMRYATSEGGLKQGVNSVAAAIWWREEEPYGSVVLTADAQNLPQERFAEIGALVAGMADDATAALGGANLKQAALQRRA